MFGPLMIIFVSALRKGLAAKATFVILFSFVDALMALWKMSSQNLERQYLI